MARIPTHRSATRRNPPTSSVALSLALDEVEDRKKFFHTSIVSRLRIWLLDPNHPRSVIILCMFLFTLLVVSFDDTETSDKVASPRPTNRVGLSPARNSDRKLPETTINHKIVNNTVAAKAFATTTISTTTSTTTKNPPKQLQLTLQNVLWSRNWHHHAQCPDLPDEYQSLKNVTSWCKRIYTTECNQKVDDLKRWFVSCNGTIWIRSQSQKGSGDLVNFINHVLPLIRHPFDLITTDGDNAIPKDVKGYEQLIGNPHLGTWYTQNYMYNGDEHSKIQPVPIGLDLHTLDRFGGLSTSEMLKEMIVLREASLDKHANRSLDFWIPPMGGSSHERGTAVRAANCLNPIFQHGRLPLLDLFGKYSQYRFGLSPPGNGVDCHRTWEMLFFGMIPIVKSSPLDLLYTKFDLPVVVVKDWGDICQKGFLDEQYERLKDKIPLSTEQLTTGYYLGHRTP